MAYLQTLDSLGLTDLNTAEQELIAQCKIGYAARFADTRPDPKDAHAGNTIHADLIAHLLQGGCDDARMGQRGVMIEGAVIKGALDLGALQSTARLYLHACLFELGVFMYDAQLAELSLDGSKLPALYAHRMVIARSVHLRDGFYADGVVDLTGSRIGGQLDCDGGHFAKGSMGHGLQIDGDCFLRNGFRADGVVDLNGSHIGGQLSCDGGHFAEGLMGHGLQIDAGCFLRDGFHADGVVDFNGSRIGGVLTCSRGHFAKGIKGHGLQIDGNCFLSYGFHATGVVDLTGSRIGGQLSCTRGHFGPLPDQPDGAAPSELDLQEVQIGADFIFTPQQAPMVVNLANASAKTLRDRRAAWDRVERYDITGFTYDRLGKTDMGLDDRLDWLAESYNLARYGRFSPAPYTQLMRVYARAGQRRHVNAVLAARESRIAHADLQQAVDKVDARSRASGGPEFRPIGAYTRFAFSWVFGRLLNYDYSVLRPLAWSLGVVLFGWAVFAYAWQQGVMVPSSDVILISTDWAHAIGAQPQNPAAHWAGNSIAGNDYESFRAFTYALDVFVPLDALGQEKSWVPAWNRGGWLGPFASILRWVMQGFGWVITAYIAALLTGVIARRAELE